jgi:hypothetical protein
MRHIQSLNEFHDLSQENNYLLDGEEEDQLSLDTESIVKDLMTSLPYYQERLPYYDGADRTLTPEEIESLAWHFAEIQRDQLEELTMGGLDNELDQEEDQEISLDAQRDSLINSWEACDIDALSDLFVDWVEDTAADGLEDWLEN